MNLKYCDNCDANIEISDVNKDECPQCFNTELEDKKVETDIVVSAFRNSVASVELTYQSTGNNFTIDFSNKVNIIGRGSIGQELLSQILVNNKPVISREHCQVEYEFETSTVYIKDLNSTNGTYVNDNKCFEKTQLKNQTIVKLGRELFFVNFIYKTNSNQSLEQEKKEVIINEPIKYYCPECNKTFKSEGYCDIDDTKLKKE
jgi:pSer/pThr/pTyr-binding forkhead associated (FHA) protein